MRAEPGLEHPGAAEHQDGQGALPRDLHLPGVRDPGCVSPVFVSPVCIVIFFRRSHRPDRGSVRQGAGHPRVRDALPGQREEAAQEGPGAVGEREGGRDKPGVPPGPGPFLGRVLRKTRRENESDTSEVSESDAWTAWGPVLQVRPRAQTQALTPDSVPEHYRSYPKLKTHSMNIQAITSLERGAIERKVEYRTYSQKLILDLKRLCNQIIMKVVQK